jgi:hypothetical protein
MTNQEAAERLKTILLFATIQEDIEALTIALRALEPATVRRICPDNRQGQECEGCYHSIPHDKNDGCGPNILNGCPACREVTP